MHTRTRVTALISILTLLITQPTLAQPDIDYLCQDDIEAIWPQPSKFFWTDREINKPNQSLIVLTGDAEDPSPDQTWAVWNDPAVAEYIKQEGYTVIFTHDDQRSRKLTEDSLYKGPPNRVAVTHKMFVQPLRDWSKLQWPSIQPTPQQLINWLKKPKAYRERIYQDQSRLINSIARNPDDLYPRMKLIESQKQLGGNYIRQQQLIPWLLIKNQQWYEYERTQNRNQLSEDEFRLMVFEAIHSAREELGLFGTISESETGTVYNKWIRLEYQASRGFGRGIMLPDKSTRWQWANMLKPHFVDVKPETLTDRDLYILKALTAEGEEWQRLVDEYRPAKPSQNLTDPPKSDP